MKPALRRRLREYALLMRLDRPIGILLLLWPTLWALWIAAGGRPSGLLLGVFVLGTVLTRSAGCIINDLLDRDIDPFVQRTRERPLASRRVSPQEALVLFAVLIGSMDLLAVGCLQGLMIFGLWLVGQQAGFGLAWLAGLVAATALFIWQLWIARDREPAECLRAFRLNNLVGMAVFAGAVVDHALRTN
jgi:4-hydroxybenzoate polyprenyltransferase